MKNTINRGWLKRQILAGNVVARCAGRYTDDYAFDAAYNYGKTGWLPARLSLGGHRFTDPESMRRGSITFDNSDFKGYGYCWLNDDGTITLSYGWESYDLDLVDWSKATPAIKIRRSARTQVPA